MIPERITNLFAFIDYLESNQKQYIEEYLPLCDKLLSLHNQLHQLRPADNYKDKQKHSELSNTITQEFQPIQTNIYLPLTAKLRELKIWSGDETFASIWNNNYSSILEFKENFEPKDVAQVLIYKEKYVSFRRQTNSDFLCLTFAFHNLDDVFKELFNFFKDTTENEFEEFEAKTIELNNLGELGSHLNDMEKRNVKISLPLSSITNRTPEREKSYSKNVNNEIIMGDKIQIGKISENRGPVIVGTGNKIEKTPESKLSRKSFNWQKWTAIIGIIISVVAVIVAILIG